jgi:hypothetical protein
MAKKSYLHTSQAAGNGIFKKREPIKNAVALPVRSSPDIALNRDTAPESGHNYSDDYGRVNVVLLNGLEARELEAAG